MAKATACHWDGVRCTLKHPASWFSRIGRGMQDPLDAGECLENRSHELQAYYPEVPHPVAFAYVECSMCEAILHHKIVPKLYGTSLFAQFFHEESKSCEGDLWMYWESILSTLLKCRHCLLCFKLWEFQDKVFQWRCYVLSTCVVQVLLL